MSQTTLNIAIEADSVIEALHELVEIGRRAAEELGDAWVVRDPPHPDKQEPASKRALP